jgi:hypothetical protein
MATMAAANIGMWQGCAIYCAIKSAVQWLAGGKTKVIDLEAIRRHLA